MDDETDAFDRVHPDLIDLIYRLEIAPTGDIVTWSEEVLARTIFLAIELADPVEQAQIVSRIITDEEAAADRLKDADVQNLNHRITLDLAERQATLRATPEPERQPDLQAAVNIGECLVCGDPGNVAVQCNCVYCLPCLRAAIRLGLRSENDFPPRCCVHFGEATIRLADRPALVHLFRQIAEEVDVPPAERLYCHDGRCAAFIPPGSNECPACGLRTCRDCGAGAHEDHERCVEGEVVEDIWETMDQHNMVNCPGCGRIIQLQEACNHMTCPCGTEFCLLCGRMWETCHCPTYGHFDLMIPVRDRPGLKPERYRRVRPRDADRAGVGPDAPELRIPRLRPIPGEEDRVPRVPERRRRVRPMGAERLPLRGRRGEPAREQAAQRPPRRDEEDFGDALRLREKVDLRAARLLREIRLEREDPPRHRRGRHQRREALPPLQRERPIERPQGEAHRTNFQRAMPAPRRADPRLYRRRLEPPFWGFQYPGQPAQRREDMHPMYERVYELLNVEYAPPGARAVAVARGWWEDEEVPDDRSRVALLAYVSSERQQDARDNLLGAQFNGSDEEIRSNFASEEM
ncbi:hypothetical protein ACJ41O_001784 [Fusarium nematophilum]